MFDLIAGIDVFLKTVLIIKIIGQTFSFLPKTPLHRGMRTNISNAPMNKTQSHDPTKFTSRRDKIHIYAEGRYIQFIGYPDFYHR